MKILIVGAEWHDSILKVIAGGFTELGHEAKIFNDVIKDNDIFLSKVAGRFALRGLSEKYFTAHRENVGKKLIATAGEWKPDLVFVVNGLKLLPETVKEIRKQFNVPVTAYIIDDPLLGKTWIYDLHAYSHLFVIDDAWMPYLEFFNPGAVYYLPQIAEHAVFRPLSIEKKYDIGFGGSLGLRLPNSPSGFLRAQILNFLAEQGFKIHAFAPGIKETFGYFPALRKIDYSDAYESHEKLNELYNSAKIVVSIHSPQFKNGISPRVFEAAFAKSFQLIEHKSDVPKLFPQGGVSFRSNPELLDLVKHYLEHADEREKMAEAAYTYAIDHHTARTRMQTALDVIQKTNARS